MIVNTPKKERKRKRQNEIVVTPRKKERKRKRRNEIVVTPRKRDHDNNRNVPQEEREITITIVTYPKKKEKLRRDIANVVKVNKKERNRKR